ncbi:MAG: response regulator transcription factor [Winkia neuii]|uniref:response regulator transcription factor n=1 Tax=Winkia neuii TaxID=33007 RepID=UPI0029090351|nr:response regulator transcription factor [Winkia neuii]MDU5161822.1 response regulator transcription factor [Winkia neuii]
MPHLPQHADGSAPLVLIADDEPMLADLLSQALQSRGWRTHAVTDGFGAVQAARKLDPDAAVLDIMMPGMGGLEAMERIRRDLPNLPILLLTALDAVEDRVQGLRSGADDYVTKPFNLDEVEARLEALVRRAGGLAAQVEETVLTVGDLQMNVDRHELARAGSLIELTKTEFDLCEYLMQNASKVVSKAQILDAVWHFDFGGKANVVELYISYLRKKIDAGRPPMIHTVRGVGYVMKPAAADEA